MRPVLLKALPRVSAAMFALATATAPARPYDVEDILKTEAFGEIVVAPGGRWLIFERRGAFVEAPSFDERSMDVLRSRLFSVDLAHPGPARPLLPDGHDGGAILLGLSPQGRRAAIARLEGEQWRLGVVTLATQAVRWFDLSPDYYPFRATIGWISEDRLVAIALPGDRLPWKMRADREDRRALEAAWAAADTGRDPTVTAVGSGRYVGVTQRPTQSELRLVDVVSGEQKALASGALQSVVVAPDGRHAALVEETEAVRIRSQAPLPTSTELRHRRLTIVDLASGRTWQPCPACDVQYRPPSWSPSGNALLFFAREDDGDWSDGKLWRANMTETRASPVDSEVRATVQIPRGDYAGARFGWLNATPVLFGRTMHSDRDDWYALLPSGPRNLTQKLARLAPTLWRRPGRAPVVAGGGRYWALGRTLTPVLADMAVVAQQPVPAMGGEGEVRGSSLFGWRPGEGWLAAAPNDKQRLRAVAAVERVEPVAASALYGQIVALATRSDNRTTLRIYGAGRSPVDVASINAHLADVADPPPIPLHHRTSGGEDVTSWLFLPHGHSGQRLPMIVIPYAGQAYGGEPPRGYAVGDGPPFTNVAVLRDHGYAVLLPSMPSLPASADGTDLAGQVLAAADAAIATGRVDAQRMGLWGHSFGGHNAALIVSQTNRFRVAVASNGLYDLATYAGTFSPETRHEPGDFQSMVSWQGWAETGQPRLGGPPWAQAAKYLANSPLYRADDIRTPILLVAGDRDFAPVQQAEQLFSALYRQGKDAILLSYWGEGHNMTSPANLRDSYQRILAWLDSHLDLKQAR